MPETAVDKDADIKTRDHYVGFAHEVLAMEAIPVSPAVQKSSDNHFRSSILAADGGHHS